MRKLVVGLVTAGLLAVAGSALAQTGDPLSLISSGAVIPFVGSGTIAPGSISFLEVTSPVGDNAGSGGVGGLHMFFFDVNCVKGPASVGIPNTANDFTIMRVDNIDSNARDGLITIGAVDVTGFALNPVDAHNPFSARTIWIDAVTNTARVLEPISIANAENVGLSGQINANDTTSFTQFLVWNPLRTAAEFWAPPEAGGFHTTLYLICPNRAITGPSASAAFPSFPARVGAGGVVGALQPFPPLVPLPAPDVTPSLKVRVYSDNESFLRDGTTSCSCLTALPITAITAAADVYTNPSVSPNGFLTELEGNTRAGTAAVCDFTQAGPGNGVDCINGISFTPANPAFPTGFQFRIVTPSVPAEGPVVFTGYRSITIVGFDIFGRITGGSASTIQGNVIDAVETQSATGATIFNGR